MLISLLCPAKINLFLEVTGKRPDGYHQLATLFAKINWCDQLSVDAQAAEKTTLSLCLTGPLAPLLKADASNLVYKAAQAFLDQFSIRAQCKITLEKQIPLGAGMGGGSSDAAGVLRALCQIFGKDPKETLGLAAKLGADVPVFLYDETFLKGEGIGEILTPVNAPGPLPYIVLVYPAVSIATKEVFKRLVLPSGKKILTNLSNLDKLIEDLRCGQPLQAWKNLLFNRLEDCVIPFVDAVRNVKQELRESNQETVLMSGSGSTVFALVPTEKEAKDLVKIIKKQERIVSLTTFRRAIDENNGNEDTSYGRGTSKSIC